MARVRRLLLSAIVIGAAACASLPPERPITARQPLVGTWKGTAYGGGQAYPSTITLMDDGTWESTSTLPPGKFNGTWQVMAGRASFKSLTTGRTGTITLHEEAGKRMIRWRSDDGVVDFNLSPAP